jgi:hypothetical protein
MVIPMAGLLALAVAAPVAAGPNVGNSSGSATTAQGSWYSEAGDGSTYGYVSAWQDPGSSETYVDFWEETGEYVDCTPGDPNDELYGFHGTYRYGGGPGTLSVGKGFGSASASGVLDVETATVDDCAGTFDSSYDQIEVTFDLVATGTKIMEKGTGSFKIPAEFNSHYSYSSTYRNAAGTASIGGDEIAVDGGIGKVSWREHSNG